MRLSVTHNGIAAEITWPEAPINGDVQVGVEGLLLAVGAPLSVLTQRVPGEHVGRVMVPSAPPSDWTYGPNASESGI